MKGFIVEARARYDNNEPKGPWEQLVFATSNDAAIDWIRDNVTNPDCDVRVLPGIAHQPNLVSNEYDIGVAH